VLLAPGSPVHLNRVGNTITGHGFYLITVTTATTGGPGGGTQNATYHYFPLQFSGKVVNGKISGDFLVTDINDQPVRGAFNANAFPVASGHFQG